MWLNHYQYHSQDWIIAKKIKIISKYWEEKKKSSKKNLIDSFILLHTQKLPLFNFFSAKIIVVASLKEEKKKWKSRLLSFMCCVILSFEELEIWVRNNQSANWRMPHWFLIKSIPIHYAYRNSQFKQRFFSFIKLSTILNFF